MSIVKKRTINSLFICTLLVGFALQATQSHKGSDSQKFIKFSGVFENAAEFTNGASLLNTDALGAQGDKIDRTCVNKAKLDLKMHAGDKEHGIDFKSTIRGRFVAGNPKLLASTTESIKLNEAFVGKHSHKLEPYLIYMQEAWLGVNFDKLFKTDLSNLNFKIGAFPYSLGIYGISLGDAFAVSPASLGFYSDRTINRYAYGLELSGDLATPRVVWDVYTAILKNTSTGLSDTGSLSYEQLLINNRPCASFSRGFGSINMLYAGRLKCKAIDQENLNLNFEPYVLLNIDPYQKIDNPEDAKSNLITTGIAASGKYEGFNFGFETAINRGEQEAFAWDRNTVNLENRAGQLVEVYNNIYDGVPGAPGVQRALYNPAAPIAMPTGSISSALNGQQIGATGFYNGTKRFRDAYTTKYRGWMAVADASVWVYKKDLKMALSAGMTSGDDNPKNKSGAVREYRGFIPLQELFSGDKVRSVFGIGGSLVRPAGILSPGGFASTIDGFTDLIFSGMGMTYAPEGYTYPFSINPNVLVFWKAHRVPAFDSITNANSTTDLASNRLGTELNTFFTLKLTDALKFSSTMAVFLPGKHYSDITGSPLDGDTATALKEAAASGDSIELLPTVGDDVAFTISGGLTYSF